MARIRIGSYALAWNPGANLGVVKIRQQDGVVRDIQVDGVGFSALSPILKEEENYWDDERNAVGDGMGSVTMSPSWRPGEASDSFHGRGEVARG